MPRGLDIVLEARRLGATGTEWPSSSPPTFYRRRPSQYYYLEPGLGHESLSTHRFITYLCTVPKDLRAPYTTHQANQCPSDPMAICILGGTRKELNSAYAAADVDHAHLASNSDVGVPASVLRMRALGGLAM